jgi:hypothetical protein
MKSMSNKGFKLNKDFEQYNESMTLGKPVDSPYMPYTLPPSLPSSLNRDEIISRFGINDTITGMKSNALSAVTNTYDLNPELVTNAIMIGQLAKQNQRGLSKGSIGGISSLKLAAILGILALSTAGGLYMYGEHKLNKHNKK